ncbi:polyprenyl diphosphate synthase [Amycolatopsis sp. NPDC049868]|uniref:polyprenyl diphosphate synthase n=1 Tax=Amycolatopsis sp. NPDC049868 TaxID=3363934 RepID=UPI00379B097E
MTAYDIATTAQTLTGVTPPGVPQHLGIILDGNRRWARRRGLPTAADGHRTGFRKIPEVLSWCDELGIKVVTLWMLSDDNIAHRHAEEIRDLHAINERVINELIAFRRWRLRHVGRTELLPARLVSLLDTAERCSSNVRGMDVNLAIAHGGRSDIVAAMRTLAEDLRADNSIEVTEALISERLPTAGQPDPDLVIRPSGEFRTSGFLLWQAARAELYFCDRLWPDFSRADLLEAIEAFAHRRRRYGA